MIDQQQLAEILRLHGMWLRGEDGGVRADLREAVLSGAVLPTGVRIASLCFGGWAVTVTRDTTTIGCQTHPNEDWLRWTPSDVAEMHPDAKRWWARYLEAVCAVIRVVMQEEVKRAGKVRKAIKMGLGVEA